MVRCIKTFDQCPHKFNFGLLFQTSSKTVKGLELNQNSIMSAGTVPLEKLTGQEKV